MWFGERLKALEAMLSGSGLAILVWGSGTGSPKDHEKRQKIQTTLKEFFRQADVKFSEDPDLRALVPGRGRISIPQEELWELAACDVCVALDTGIGVGQELARYLDTVWAHKVLILTHEKYKGSTSFPAAIRENHNQIFYSEAEYDSCSLCAHVLDHVKQVALAKLSKVGLV
jgi:hypothetical protein